MANFLEDTIIWNPNVNAFLRNLGPVLDHNICRLENFLLIGDLNSEITEIMKDICES